MFIDWRLVGIAIAGCFAGSIIQRGNFMFSLFSSILHAYLLLFISFAFSWGGDGSIAVRLTWIYLQFYRSTFFLGPPIVTLCVVFCYTMEVTRFFYTKTVRVELKPKPNPKWRIDPIRTTCMIVFYLTTYIVFRFLLRPFWKKIVSAHHDRG